MPSVICSSVCSVLMGGGRRELGIVQGNVALKKKLSLLLAFLSLMHASICMYITDRNVYGLELSKLLNVSCLSFSPCSTSPHPNHLKIFEKSLQSRFV